MVITGMAGELFGFAVFFLPLSTGDLDIIFIVFSHGRAGRLPGLRITLPHVPGRLSWFWFSLTLIPIATLFYLKIRGGRTLW